MTIYRLRWKKSSGIVIQRGAEAGGIPQILIDETFAKIGISPK
jgi:hypothetical protein